MNKENWKAIPGFEGYYEVSDLGRVKSLDRELVQRNGVKQCFKGQILKPGETTHGRLTVSLRKKEKKKTYKVHILVALSFLGERPEGYHVCHLDGNVKNNKLSNLRYDTKSENEIDRYRQGKKAGSAKLSIKQVLEIRRLYATGDCTYKELSDIYGVSKSNIGFIVRREYFSWLNDDGSITESQTAVS